MTTSPTTIPTTLGAATGSPASRTRHHTLVITPNSGLTDHERVFVTASGFFANESDLITIECANNDTATGVGDCDIAGARGVTADSKGVVKASISVVTGPFGSNHIVCGSPNPCEISVTQVNPNPAQEVDRNIAFGGQ